MTRYVLTALACALGFAGSVFAAGPSAKTLGRLVVKVGTHRTYSRMELRPGATVVCRYEGHMLSVTAPTGRSEGNGTVWPQPGINDQGLFHLNVNVAQPIGYAVACGLGGVHSEPVIVP